MLDHGGGVQGRHQSGDVQGDCRCQSPVPLDPVHAVHGQRPIALFQKLIDTS